MNDLKTPRPTLRSVSHPTCEEVGGIITLLPYPVFISDIKWMSAMKWDERKALLAAPYIYEYLRKESRKMARAYVYVDGFNLYYGALKRTQTLQWGRDRSIAEIGWRHHGLSDHGTLQLGRDRSIAEIARASSICQPVQSARQCQASIRPRSIDRGNRYRPGDHPR